MGKKKEYKETNRMFLKRLASQEGVLHCRVVSIIKCWRLVEELFLRDHGVLLPYITREV